jgi:hypothetical protein
MTNRFSQAGDTFSGAFAMGASEILGNQVTVTRRLTMPGTDRAFAPSDSHLLAPFLDAPFAIAIFADLATR